MYLFEKLLKQKEAEGRLDATEYEIDYGDRAEHCWNVRSRPCHACAGLGVTRFRASFRRQGDDEYEGDEFSGSQLLLGQQPGVASGRSRFRYNTMYLERILARIAESAPAGADLASWRY